MSLKKWAVAVFRGKVESFFCEACKKRIEFRQEYAYKYTPEGTVILHNKEECYELWTRTSKENKHG